MSAEVYEELQAFMSDHPETTCGMVLVIEDRELSDSMEEQLVSL